MQGVVYYWLFVQQLILANIREASHLHSTGPLWGNTSESGGFRSCSANVGETFPCYDVTKICLEITLWSWPSRQLLYHFNCLTLNVRGPSYLGFIRSISCLLMLWLLTSPGHQQPWYWQYRICRSFSYLKKDFKYLCHINEDEWHKMWIHVMFPLKNLARKGLIYCRLGINENLACCIHFRRHEKYSLFFLSSILVVLPRWRQEHIYAAYPIQLLFVALQGSGTSEVIILAWFLWQYSLLSTRCANILWHKGAIWLERSLPLMNQKIACHAKGAIWIFGNKIQQREWSKQV